MSRYTMPTVYERAPVYVAAVPQRSSEAELRCGGTYDRGRDCRRLLIRVYRGVLGPVELYCARCRCHHRVVIDFTSTSGGAKVEAG